MYNRLVIPPRDRQTDWQRDKQTSCNAIVRTMHTCRAVKPTHDITQYSQNHQNVITVCQISENITSTAH